MNQINKTKETGIKLSVSLSLISSTALAGTFEQPKRAFSIGAKVGKNKVQIQNFAGEVVSNKNGFVIVVFQPTANNQPGQTVVPLFEKGEQYKNQAGDPEPNPEKARIAHDDETIKDLLEDPELIAAITGFFA